ncbi:MAG: dTDP-glucose 4,6-dehydratase [Bacteroidota bacterium]|nr:dTDP-glucose 4,6-dehydratase [Bacteroidota bacterium]
MNIWITGCAGFIGANLTQHLVNKYPEYQFTGIDCISYAGNVSNLWSINQAKNFVLCKVDITDIESLKSVWKLRPPSKIIHLAAESHVDNSIINPNRFILTNVNGTANLLELCRQNWADLTNKLFYHISTDEVFGQLGDNGHFDLNSNYNPRSPYSASKAASDHLVRAYHHTYQFPSIISNCSNNYGAFQFPEKLIPLIITRALAGEPLPVYGLGLQIRDWLHVTDHVSAIDLILHNGTIGHTYLIGGNNEVKNIDMVHLICKELSMQTLTSYEKYVSQITYVTDRKGHDYRYAIDTSYISKELNWQPAMDISTGISQTVHWYLDNQEWTKAILDNSYRNLSISTQEFLIK